MEKFTYIPVYSSFVKNETELQKIAGNYFDSLKSIGGKRVDEMTTDDDFPYLFFVITGGTEQLILNLLKKGRNLKKNDLIILISHPTHNSLPASLETLARLQQDKIKGKIIFINGSSDKLAFDKIIKNVENLNISKYLNNSRIGLIGEPSDWLVASTPEFRTVEKTWGPEIIEIQIAEIFELLNNSSIDEFKQNMQSLVSEAAKVIEPAQSELEDNVKVYLALRKIITKYNLDALTVRCFDLVTGFKTTGCFGLAQLNDDGYIAGCEGDLVSTIGMLWINKLLDQIPWMANPVEINEKNNTLWLAHCTVPRSLVKNYNLRSHFESGLGVGIQGFFEEGPVTLLRIGGKKMEKLWVVEGKIISTGNSEHLCRTQVEIELIDSSVKDLLLSPLGNHVILIQGKHSERLTDYWETIIKPKNNECK